ncbi:MAG: hypothetical protein AAF290_03330 [Pseudomonadota bacterium]
MSDSFLGGIFKAIANAFAQMLAAFAVGTAVAAAVCWYYGLPLILSLGGGLIVIGVWLALQSESSLF